MSLQSINLGGDIMTRSAFQFTDPSLLKLDFQVNDNFIPDQPLAIPIQFTVHNKRDESETAASIRLSATLGERNDNMPYFIDATIGADFKWERGKYSDQSLNDLLNKNAPALLLSYLRPIIASITNASPYPAHNLPFFDFTQEPLNSHHE